MSYFISIYITYKYYKISTNIEINLFIFCLLIVRFFYATHGEDRFVSLSANIIQSQSVLIVDLRLTHGNHWPRECNYILPSSGRVHPCIYVVPEGGNEVYLV